MADVTRYQTKIEDETFAVETDDGWLEVGDVEDIIDLFGGETYVLEYSDKQASVAWLDTDEDNTITVDVRETMETMSYTDDFVSKLASTPLDEETDEGYPKRTDLYVALMREILDSKGNVGE
ncbi:hypothetical protein [Halarchaeum sp. P4]|uniref:hypothetical protein n=1 Tax=Halarchaeum sp. P4 TaxID=3421639 RepID=UPI003EBB8E0A